MTDAKDLAVAVAARVDALEGSLERRAKETEGLARDVGALGKAVARLIAAREHDDGQLDWVNVETAGAAVSMLRAAVRFHDRHLPYLEAGLPPCWPWHAFVVVEVVALAAQYPASYGGGPAGVSDLLNRWLPGFKARTRKALGDCNRTEHHDGDGHVYAVDVAQTDRLAEWWATDRRGHPPGLTEK